MSGREGRDSDSRRNRSRFDREPSPKRSRRDGKHATERVRSSNNLESRDHSDRDQKYHRRLQDAVPLEAPVGPDSKVETRIPSKESEEKHNGHLEATKHSSDPTDIPRSRSYFQHDERGSSRQVGRSLARGAAAERGWWRDAKEHNKGRAADKDASNDTHPRDMKTHAKRDDDKVWHHDRFRELEADPPPPIRKRPAFREKKVPVESENADKAVIEPEKESRPDHGVVGRERREDRGRNPHNSDRSERPSSGERVQSRGEAWRGGFSSRERYGSVSGTYRGRDRYNGRQRFSGSSNKDEKKWEHDLFDEASKSPQRKNEEDQIAKVEALLAS